MSDTRVTSSSPSVVNPSGSGNQGASGVPGSTTGTNQVPTTPGTPGGTTGRNTDSSRVLTISENDFWKDQSRSLKSREATAAPSVSETVVTSLYSACACAETAAPSVSEAAVASLYSSSACAETG